MQQNRFYLCTHVRQNILTWAVEVLEDHVGHEAPDVKLDVAGLNLGLDDLLGNVNSDFSNL